MEEKQKSHESPTADLILFGGNVITMDPAFPRAETVCVKDGRVLCVGTNNILEQHRGMDTKVINCQGRTIVPGFIDAHCHFTAFAESFSDCCFTPKEVHSISDIQEKIRRFSKNLPQGEWITAGTYDEFYLDGGRHPTKWDLDSATSIHPVRLIHRSGHAHVLNSLAMNMIGISTESPEPPGTIIERDLEEGEPNGILLEMGPFISKGIPPKTEKDKKNGARLANQQMLSVGITSIQDASSQNNINRWQLFRQWKTTGDLKLRVNMMLGLEAFDLYRRKGFFHTHKDDQISISGVKIILSEITGRLHPSQSELNELVLQIHESRLQAVIHAIEETSIEAASIAIEYALEKSPQSDHRHRIEHCAVCPPPLSRRLASLGIMVVTQPSFIYYNGERYIRTVPDRQFEHLYPLATLIDNGVQVAGSSDCPIWPPNPLIGIYSAVSRMSESGEEVLAKEGVTAMDALRMHTCNGAKACFEEEIKGSIMPGKMADMVVLSSDPTTVPPEEIKDIHVEMTILDGDVVWEREANQ